MFSAAKGSTREEDGLVSGRMLGRRYTTCLQGQESRWDPQVILLEARMAASRVAGIHHSSG